MNVRNLTAAAALVLATVVAAPATAAISTGNLAQDVQSALSSSDNVTVQLKDGVATLTGDVRDASARLRVRLAALSNPDVTSVVNNLTY